MTSPIRTFVLGTSIVVAIATELQAAGVYSGASGFTPGDPANPIPQGSTPSP